MAYRLISNVQVGKWKPGTIFGDCMIFAFNMKFGVGESKSTCSLSIINEKGKYPKELTEINQKTSEVPYLSYVNHYDIKVTGLVMRMYLVSAQETYGPDGKYFQLNFVDGSHILDRTFVGLLHRHDGFNRDINVGRLHTGFAVPVICPPCDPNKSTFQFKNIHPDGKVYDEKGNLIETNPDYGKYVKREIRYSKQLPIGNNKIGGIVIVGTEQFSTSDCDLKDVDYNFTELIQALKKFGIAVFIRDRKPEYRATHVGTLREVLAAWCADFGVTWTYDSFSIIPKVIETNGNTSKAANYIQTINTVARSIDKKTSTTLVESIDYHVSIEDTYRQYLVTAYKKPSTPKQYAKNTFYRTYLENIGVEEIFEQGFLDGRDYDQFKTSCCFARFSPELRTLYLLTQGSYTPLGFTPVHKCDDVLKKNIIDYCLNTDSYLDLLDYIAGSGASLKEVKDADFDMFLGSYDKNMEDAYLDWEKNVSNTFGKYWMTSILPNDRQICPEGINFKFELKSSIIPEAPFFYKKHEDKAKKKKCQPATQILSPASQKELLAGKFEAAKYVITNNVPGGLPFNNILRGPLGKNIFTVAPPHTVKGGGGQLKFSEFVRIFERSGATWNVDEADWECQLTNPVTNESLVQKYMPRYQPVEGLIKTRLLSLFANNNPKIRETIEGARGQVPTIMIVPKKKRLQKLLKVSPLTTQENELEVENTWQSKTVAKTEEKDCTTTALCEIQANLTTAVCKCDDKGGPPPKDKKSGVIYDAKNSAWVDGLLNNKSLGFTWEFTPDPIERSQEVNGKFVKSFDTFVSSMDVVFPCGVDKTGDNELYQANYMEDVKRTTWSNKIQEIRNDFLRYPVGNVSAVRVVPNEATQNMDAFPTDVTGGSVAKVFLPPSNFQGLGKMLDLDAYHLLMNTLNDLGTFYPKVSLTVNLGNVIFGELLPYVQPEFGLQDFNIKIDEGGGSATLSWTSGLGKKPKHDLVMTQVMPRAKYSMYVR